MSRALSMLAVLLALAAPRAARAEGQPQTHDGFYARLQLGGTVLTAHQGDTDYLGPGVALGLAAGGVLRRDLALFATLTFHVAVDPRIQVGGVSMPISGSSVEDDAFGAGLAYYLEPLNAYAAAAITGSSVQLYDKDDNRLAGSNTGLGFQLMAGKEWWVGREWGVGVAAEVTAAWMKDADLAGVRWSSSTYSLLFSATYN